MKKETKDSLATFLTAFFFGIGLGMALVLFSNFPRNPYHLETQKEYIAFHVDTTDFPMVAIDQMITVLEDNGVTAEAIVFVKNRKPVSQIKLGLRVIKSPEKEEEKK